MQCLQTFGIDKKDIDEMKALGFCVSKEHAQFMAHFFNDNGISSLELDLKFKSLEIFNFSRIYVLNVFIIFIHSFKSLIFQNSI